jgi:drug/metabolite transporter (DMT)-like permease
MKKNFSGTIYLSIGASLWGGMYVASKYALDTIPPFTLLFLRYFLASVILIGWCRKSRISIQPKQNKWLLFSLGFWGCFLSVAMQFIGTKLSSAQMGSVLTTLSPVFQSLFAFVLLKEKILTHQMLSIILSFLGVFIITDAVAIMQHGSINAGTLFLLAAAALWGYYSILVKQASEFNSTLRITTWGIVLATVFSFPPAIYEFGSWDVSVLRNRMVIFSLLYLGIASSVIAYYCWNKGLTLTNPHQAGLFIFFQPIVGSILGYFLLGEALTLSFVIGTILIIAAVGISISLNTSPVDIGKILKS